MAQVKYATAYVTVPAGGTIAAPTTNGVDIASPGDDDKNRHVTGIWVGVSTAGLKVDLAMGGGKKTDVDCSIFSPAYGPIPVDQQFPVGQSFHVDFYNTNAGVATNVPVSIRYEVP